MSSSWRKIYERDKWPEKKEFIQNYLIEFFTLFFVSDSNKTFHFIVFCKKEKSFSVFDLVIQNLSITYEQRTKERKTAAKTQFTRNTHEKWNRTRNERKHNNNKNDSGSGNDNKSTEMFNLNST